jgi:hypothetical protein
VTELPTFDWITEPQEVPAALKKLKPEQDVVCLICSDKCRRSPLTNECTARELIAEIEGVISRQSMSRYTILEIANILASENNLDTEELFKRLAIAANDRTLALRNPNTGGIPITPTDQVLIWSQWVSPEDMNALLASWKVNYRLEWPRPWRLPATGDGIGQQAPQAKQHLSGSNSPWLTPNPNDPKAKYHWYTPARYFARQLVKDDSTLLAKKALLASKVVTSLSGAGFKKRGGANDFDPGTVLKALTRVNLG